jgi:hypothetical protein
MNMAKKSKKVNRASSDIKIIEAALELGGVPTTDDLGEEMSLSGRVISVMQRLHSMSTSRDTSLIFDPHNPQALLDRMEEEGRLRKAATNPVRPKQPKKQAKRKATPKAKKAKSPRRNKK